MTPTKKDIRKENIKKRNSIPVIEQIRNSQKILGALSETDFWKNSKTVMIYLSIGSEVFTLALITLSILEGKTILLPKVSGRDIIPVKVGRKFKLVSGFKGILEPNLSETFSGEIDIVIVPLVAFDEKGYRIGYGGGFYDRFLKSNKVKLKVGLAYEIQKVKNLQPDDFDEKLDIVITENNIYYF
ncbi:MAG: 5-formyltetrahydrofolate cyclo-ligase [Brevinematia bacterium]